MPGSVELGQRIQMRRRELGYRFAKDFAAALGWNASMVSRVENGERGLIERDIEQLARHLRVDRSWFSGGGGEAHHQEGLASFSALVEEVLALRREEAAILERMVDLLRRG